MFEVKLDDLIINALIEKNSRNDLNCVTISEVILYCREVNKYLNAKGIKATFSYSVNNLAKNDSKYYVITEDDDNMYFSVRPEIDINQLIFHYRTNKIDDIMEAFTNEDVLLNAMIIDKEEIKKLRK